MATNEKGKLLTNRQIMMVAASISADNMESIALRYFDFSKELIDSVKKDNGGDSEEISRSLIRKWANMNSENQVQVRLNTQWWHSFLHIATSFGLNFKTR